MIAHNVASDTDWFYLNINNLMGGKDVQNNEKVERNWTKIKSYKSHHLPFLLILPLLYLHLLHFWIRFWPVTIQN
jgi:hypothetical protein